MNELVKWLRAEVADAKRRGDVGAAHAWLAEAADELEDAVDKLRPFARAAAGFDSDEWSDDDALGYRELTVGHLRDAARVVAKYTKPGGYRT